MSIKYIHWLANAIIAQAAKDYRNALKCNDKGSILECERFFVSEWFTLLTDMDGKYLIEKLRKQQEVT